MSVRSLLPSLLVGLWVSFVAVCAHSPELREAEGADKPGGVQYTEDEYAEAEPLHKRALAIREMTLGPQHPAVATGLIGLAAGQRIIRRHSIMSRLTQLPYDKRYMAHRNPGVG